MFRCDHHDTDLDTIEAIAAHTFLHVLALETQMTEFANDQAHLDADVAGLTAAFATVIAELKNQTGSGQLDFSKADALVASIQAEATADAIVDTTPPADVPPVDDGTTDPNASA